MQPRRGRARAPPILRRLLLIRAVGPNYSPRWTAPPRPRPPGLCRRAPPPIPPPLFWSTQPVQWAPSRGAASTCVIVSAAMGGDDASRRKHIAAASETAWRRLGLAMRPTTAVSEALREGRGGPPSRVRTQPPAGGASPGDARAPSPPRPCNACAATPVSRPRHRWPLPAPSPARQLPAGSHQSPPAAGLIVADD